MADKANVVIVREFLNHNSSRPVTMPEMSEFWKSLTPEEKDQYARQAAQALQAEKGAAAAA